MLPFTFEHHIFSNVEEIIFGKHERAFATSYGFPEILPDAARQLVDLPIGQDLFFQLHTTLKRKYFDQFGIEVKFGNEYRLKKSPDKKLIVWESLGTSNNNQTRNFHSFDVHGFEWLFHPGSFIKKYSSR